MQQKMGRKIQKDEINQIGTIKCMENLCNERIINSWTNSKPSTRETIDKIQTLVEFVLERHEKTHE